MQDIKKSKGAGIINQIIYGSIGLTVLFLMFSTIVMSHFNTTYNYTVTGLSAATTQGLFLLVLVLALIGFAVRYIPSVRK